MRTETTFCRPSPRFCSSRSRLDRILRVWSSTDSGNATEGFSSSTGPTPEMKPQPPTQASGGADMLEQAPDAACHLELARPGIEMIGLDVRHGRAPPEVAERLRVGKGAGRRNAHDRLVRIRPYPRVLDVEPGGRRRLPSLHRPDRARGRAARQHHAAVGSGEVLRLAVSDRPLARHRVVVARLPLAFLVGPVAGLAYERDLVDAEELGAEPAVGIVVMVEMGHADVERMRIVERHRPAG